jgi:arylformamidase
MSGSHELDAQYDTSKQLPDGDVTQYFEKFLVASALARENLACDLGRRYGAHERETIDFFPATRPNAPLFFWVHGGYWRRMSKDASSLVAPPLVAAGAAVAVVNYPLAPGPTLDAIVSSARRGFAYARAHAESINADPANVYLGGHSVGAQLAAMIAAADEVRGLLALSGLYDLEPLRATHINEWIAMDAETAARNGPIHNPPLGNPSLLIAAGGLEQQAFADQQRSYVAAWRSWGHAARELEAPQHNHFTIVLELADPASPISKALRERLFA